MGETRITAEISPSSLPSLLQALDSGANISITVTGNSMYPFLISCRDSVTLTKTDVPPKKYDVVLFVRKNGKYVLHRIHKVFDDGKYEMLGDGQFVSEYPVDISQIKATALSVTRKGKEIKSGSFKWKLYSFVCTNKVFKNVLLKRALKNGGKNDD